ncbi:hypothetical protein F5Y18DRAFT_428113 [Xylariaceae sp. FL1019]|nr:hypothetical protein F5Y18DRAFT_428113 [Xylariaceae sp. FL1019]
MSSQTSKVSSVPFPLWAYFMFNEIDPSARATSSERYFGKHLVASVLMKMSTAQDRKIRLVWASPMDIMEKHVTPVLTTLRRKRGRESKVSPDERKPDKLTETDVRDFAYVKSSSVIVIKKENKDFVNASRQVQVNNSRQAEANTTRDGIASSSRQGKADSANKGNVYSAEDSRNSAMMPKDNGSDSNVRDLAIVSLETTMYMGQSNRGSHGTTTLDRKKRKRNAAWNGFKASVLTAHPVEECEANSKEMSMNRLRIKGSMKTQCEQIQKLLASGTEIEDAMDGFLAEE